MLGGLEKPTIPQYSQMTKDGETAYNSPLFSGKITKSEENPLSKLMLKKASEASPAPPLTGAPTQIDPLLKIKEEGKVVKVVPDVDVSGHKLT